MRMLDEQLLNRLQQSPADRKQLGDQLLHALLNVARTSDYNTAFPGAPLGRAEAMDALARLNAALAEAFNVVPGVDVPKMMYDDEPAARRRMAELRSTEPDMFGGFEPDQEEREHRARAVGCSHPVGDCNRCEHCPGSLAERTGPKTNMQAFDAIFKAIDECQSSLARQRGNYWGIQLRQPLAMIRNIRDMVRAQEGT